uniref:WH2 domain-containing protein n=1 Tax=Panagrolaimus sp. ES5 TaxID=591445 RepID=A0AC34FXW8_9BILA
MPSAENDRDDARANLLDQINRGTTLKKTGFLELLEDKSILNKKKEIDSNFLSIFSKSPLMPLTQDNSERTNSQTSPPSLPSTSPPMLPSINSSTTTKIRFTTFLKPKTAPKPKLTTNNVTNDATPDLTSVEQSHSLTINAPQVLPSESPSTKLQQPKTSFSKAEFIKNSLSGRRPAVCLSTDDENNENGSSFDEN